MQDCETNDCRKEKRGCEGCYYNKESLIKDIDRALENFKNELHIVIASFVRISVINI